MARRVTPEGAHKYGARQAVAHDGTVFPSKRECKRYEELRLLEKMGKIVELQTQVKYELVPAQKRDDGKAERAVTYTLDFQYFDKEARAWRYEDSKGMKTQQYVIRRKLMLWIHGITIQEV